MHAFRMYKQKQVHKVRLVQPVTVAIGMHIAVLEVYVQVHAPCKLTVVLPFYRIAE